MDTEREPQTTADVASSVAAELQQQVAAMNTTNVQVRPHRELVDRYSQPEAWHHLSPKDRQEIADHLSGLPTEFDTGPEDARRFDLLMLRLQIALLRGDPSFAGLQDVVIEIASRLQEKRAIPVVAAQSQLLEEVQFQDWWQDVTVVMLERVRTRLRSLVGLVDKARRNLVYSDFEDELSGRVDLQWPHPAGTDPGDAGEQFRLKARSFLRKHQSTVAINKLRLGKSLTPTDVDQLQHILTDSGGVGTQEEWEDAARSAGGLGLFIRSLVGLDRSAATAALDRFINGRTLKANQLNFLSLIIDYLTEQGTMPPERLYESPFTDIDAGGPEELFGESDADNLVAVLSGLDDTAQIA